ncbi:MAG TPA: ATP-binding protein [Terracidiphilus sp.]|nr:ATP-binding protein [Terracidiphilus sp.]
MKFRLQPRSIAFRLIVAVLAVELLSAILVVVLSFGYERHIHFRVFDVMLHGRADSILGAVQDAEDPGDNLMLDQADLHIPSDDIYAVYDQSGHVLGRSPNWQGAGPGAPTHPFGDYSQLDANGHHYRVLRIEGSRTVDPGEHGGKLRQVTILYGSPTGRVWHAIRGAVEFYAAGSLFLLLVTGPLIAWLLHRGLLPLRQLAALASQVSVDAWQFSPPVSARTTPELAPLTHALESALQRLERSFLQQRAFVSDAAHELKTAVAVVKSSLQLLNMKSRSVQEYKAGLERCLADSHRLEALVADMLALARAESSAPRPGPHRSADLAACLRQTVALLETFAALRNVQVHVSNRTANQTEVPVSIPPEECTLLLSNLLLNAIQHSPPASTVEIDLSIDSDQGAPTAVLAIQDHGDGIPGEALPHVFDRFYRGDPSRTRNTGGTGLGLAIAKAIAQKAAGSIDLTSQPDPAEPNQGTTVTVRLPIASSSNAEN